MEADSLSDLVKVHTGSQTKRPENDIFTANLRTQDLIFQFVIKFHPFMDFDWYLACSLYILQSFYPTFIL